MSKFIKNMFSETKGCKPVQNNLIMTAESSTPDNYYPMVLCYTFKAVWKMKANGNPEDFDDIHKIALEALKREVYGEFMEKLDQLQFALYEFNTDKAKEIVKEIREEI